MGRTPIHADPEHAKENETMKKEAGKAPCGGSWFPDASLIAERVRGLDARQRRALYDREAETRGVERRQIGRMVEAAEYVHLHARADKRRRRVNASVGSIEALRTIAAIDGDLALEMKEGVLSGEIGPAELAAERLRLVERHADASRIAAVLDREPLVAAALAGRKAWTTPSSDGATAAIAGRSSLSAIGETILVDGELLDPAHARRRMDDADEGGDGDGPGYHRRAVILSPLVRGARREGRPMGEVLAALMMASAVYDDVVALVANEAEGDAVRALVAKAPSGLGNVEVMDLAEAVGADGAATVIRVEFRRG